MAQDHMLKMEEKASYEAHAFRKKFYDMLNKTQNTERALEILRNHTLTMEKNIGYRSEGTQISKKMLIELLEKYGKNTEALMAKNEY